MNGLTSGRRSNTSLFADGRDVEELHFRASIAPQLAAGC